MAHNHLMITFFSEVTECDILHVRMSAIFYELNKLEKRIAKD